MDQSSRKGVAAIAAAREEAPAAASAAVSPRTVLELDAPSANGRRQYKGRFEYKVPTMGGRVDISALKAQYLQQSKGVDAVGDHVAEALAYLYVTIDHEKAPQWWKDSNRGIDLYDFQPLLKLYAAARAYEATFLGDDPDAGGDDIEASVGADAHADGGVDDAVQAPPERREVLASFGQGSRGTAPARARDGVDPG